MATAEERPDAAGRHPVRAAVELFRSPARTFALVAIVAGVAIAVLAPAFSGIDEPGHFLRATRIAEGRFLPDPAPADATAGGGTCVPRPVLREISYLIIDYRGGGEPPPPAQLDARYPTCGAPGDDRAFLSTATFSWYSPLGYAPQSVAALVGRVVGLPLGLQLLLVRLATLAAYVALVTWAIRRAPAGRWALAAVALLPVSLFEAATSASPDAITTALVIVVVSSAWRAYRRPEVVGTRPFLVESIGASLALGLAKPSYVLVALAYLVPLVAERRRASWTLALPAAVGGLTSALWYGSQRSGFVCDVVYFGIAPDPDTQLAQITRQPLAFVGATGRAAVEHGSAWLDGAFAVGERVTTWTAGPLAAVIGISIFVLVGAARAPGEDLRPRLPARAAMVGLGVVGYLAVLAGWLVYCSAPELALANPPHARLLVPVLPALAVGLAPAGRFATRLGRSAFPVGVLVAAADLVFVVGVGVTMR